MAAVPSVTVAAVADKAFQNTVSKLHNKVLLPR